MAKTTIEVDGEDVETGNTYDKYASKNPIERKLMDGFFTALDQSLPDPRGRRGGRRGHRTVGAAMARCHLHRR
jgi:imidazolonepropionase-like amidohydrolase